MQPDEKFNFSKLPYDLQVGVLELLDLETRLKLLQVNQGCRQLVLHRGPFGKRIKKLDLSDLMSGTNYYLWIDDYEIKPQANVLLSMRLLKQVQVIRELRAGQEVPEKIMELLARSLAKLKYLHSMWLDNIYYCNLKVFFENCIDLQVTDTLDIRTFNSIDNATLNRIFERHFLETKAITLGVIFGKPQIYLEALAKTNVQFIRLHCLCYGYRAFKFFIDQGLLTRYSTVCSEIRPSSGEMNAILDELSVLRQIHSRKNRHKVIKAILDSDNGWSSKVDANDDSIKIFRKSISSQIDSYYMVVEKGGPPFICVKNLPFDFLLE